MLREVTELESIGDSCYHLARTINHKFRGNEDFTEKQYDHIHQMLQLTDNALQQMYLWKKTNIIWLILTNHLI